MISDLKKYSNTREKLKLFYKKYGIYIHKLIYHSDFVYIIRRGEHADSWIDYSYKEVYELYSDFNFYKNHFPFPDPNNYEILEFNSKQEAIAAIEKYLRIDQMRKACE